MKKLLLLNFILLFISYCQAQTDNIKFNLVEGNNGEPLGQINAIAQDPNGYMWFNGQGKNRLYRYDGVKMKSFKPDDLHPTAQFGANLETIYADSGGHIWVGFFMGGMEELNPATGIFKHFVHDSSNAASISDGMVSAILRDHLGRLWVGTANGLDRLDEKTGTFIHYRRNPNDTNSISSNYVRTIYEDHAGVLWIGTGFEFSFGGGEQLEDGGLNRLEENGKFTRFMHDPKNPKSLVNNKVRAIFEDSHGTFWVGTSGDGLHSMNRQTGIFERHLYNADKPNQISRPPLKGDGFPDPITFIKEDAAGNLWIGTYNSGINRYSQATGKVTHYEASNGYPDKSCWAAVVSRDGVLWLSSTDQGGFLFRVTPEIRGIKENISINNVSCMYEDDEGILWAAGFKAGLQKFDKNKNLLRTFEVPEIDSVDLSNSNINSIFPNGRDQLLLSTDDGIAVFNKNTNHFSWLGYKSAPNAASAKFPYHAILQLARDQRGMLWVSSANGLLMYDPAKQSARQYLHNDHDATSITGNLVTSVLATTSGDIWAGTGDMTAQGTVDVKNLNKDWGINRLNKNTGGFFHYLDSTNILCMYNDPEGNIWAGSAANGLYLFNEKDNRFNLFFDDQSVTAGNPIVNITEDNQKNLWVITASSIVRVNPDRKRYFIYGKRYGIRANTLRLGGVCKTQKGEMLVINNNGFSVLPTNEMKEESRPLQLLLTGFSINNQPVSVGAHSVLTAPIEQTGAISLNHEQGNFAFNFAAIDYREPESNKYYTLLENFDSVWRDAANDKSATYINVPPGDYVFRVRAINIDGVKSEKAVTITVNPPWWKTTAAYAVYIICFLALIIIANRIIRNRIIEKERRKNREKELAHAREIENAYIELKSTQAQLIHREKMASLGEMSAGIAHEIQNPLNFVNNFSEVSRELIEELKAERSKAKSEESEKLELEIIQDIDANLEKINHHGRRADAIVKGMLQHSRSNTGQKEMADINALADVYLRLAYQGIQAKASDFQATILTVFDSTIGNINIIPEDIGRVLTNLYNNAFYAVQQKQKQNSTGYDPTIQVITKNAGDQVLITVMDNGDGIPPGVVNKIFQPFFTTKPTGQGTGLGLSLSYDIVKAHGGELTLQSGNGTDSDAKQNETVFVIQLPKK